MPKYKILIIDDEKLIRWSLSSDLSKRGFEVIVAETGEIGLKSFAEENPHMVLTDIKLPGINGIDVLKEIKSKNSEIPVIMITAYGDVKTAVESMKIGAYDYITKPFDFDEINIVIERALEISELKTEITELRKEKTKTYNFKSIIGESKATKNVITLAKKIISSNTSTVLISGESGVGKDFLAKVIHFEGIRKDKPFVEISCGAIPDNLLESELFGYERGSFTDAKQRKQGLFELADTGTIFLNEIGDMSEHVQSKVLKVIEDKTFRKIGGTRDIEVDVRIIAATNKDLMKLAETGKFREDLYFRINVLPIFIPPLRERKEDIEHLFKYFLKECCSEFRLDSIPLVSKSVIEMLINYDWPGNVRELKNLVERVLILNRTKEITPEILPDEIKQTICVCKSDGFEISIPDEGIKFEEIEKNIIITALKKCNGNQVKAAKLIGLTRDTLRYRIEKFKINIE